MNRTLGLASIICMLLANAALVTRDLAPAWFAGDPPPPGANDLRPGWVRVWQTGIFDDAGVRLGTSWSESHRPPDKLLINNFTLLNEISTGGDILTPRLRINTSFIYRDDNRLEALKVTVGGFGLPIRLEGQFVPPNEFPCEWQWDTHRGVFVLPADATRSMGDATRPFDTLSDLHVGQSWRMELFDPLAGILPGWQGEEMSTRSVIVRVVGTENIIHNGLGVHTYIVEADRIRAWVSPIGRVIRQEVHMPLLGKILMLDEAYDDAARARARDASGDS